MSGALWFYQLEHSGLEAALAPLLEKCLARGWRALVRGGVRARLEALDDKLWTYRDDAFLPHGLAGRDAGAPQPVWLTDNLDNPNAAQALFVIDGADPQGFERFERACLVFDAADEAALAGARARWRAAKSAGADAVFWREEAPGRWVKQG